MKKKDVGENGQELWTIVERCYSKIYDKNVSVVPILPNLITTLLPTIVFATPTKKEEYIFDCKAN